MTESLERTTFETSRILEFFSEKELLMQIGQPRALWPLALVKELIDNALDACEDAGIPPEIIVTVEENAVSVQDNGPGLPVETLERSLNYLVRVSDKAHYASPTRGQLGNALKCVWAAPYVADGEQGRVDVITGGKTHRVDVTLDRIAEQPRLKHIVGPDGVVKTGTFVKMHWLEIASFCWETPNGQPPAQDRVALAPRANCGKIGGTLSQLTAGGFDVDCSVSTRRVLFGMFAVSR